MNLVKIDRRSLLRGFGATGMALAIGCSPLAAKDITGRRAGNTVLGPFVGIAEDGTVTIVCPAADMGQGALDSMGRLVAEELGCAWDQVALHQAWADPRYENPVARKQRTANSESVRGYWEHLRQAGAAVRTMIATAAARQWGVPVGEIEVAEGFARHSASGRKAPLGEFAAAAAKLPVPDKIPLKAADAFTLIGKRLPRKDIPAKVFGTAQFGMDVTEPGMLTAALQLAAHPQLKVNRFDAKAALASPGVVAAIAVDGGVAVLADTYWNAQKAAALVTLETDASPTAGVDSARIDDMLATALASGGRLPFPEYDTKSFPMKMVPADPAAVAAAFAGAAHVTEQLYQVPYLAHGTMEPLCCAAKRTEDGLHVIGPIQAPGPAREEAAALTGLPIEKIKLDLTFLGGGFGRKWPVDFVRVAIQAALAAPGRLVRTMWTRDQDFAVDQFRPGFLVRTRSAFDADKNLIAMHSHMAGQSIWRYQGRPQIPGVGDPNAAGLLIYDRYAIPRKMIEFSEVDLKIPAGYWRGVTFSQNGFFAESAIDEAARHGGNDPYRYRRALLKGDPRTTAVLDKAAELIGWDDPRPKGRGRGIALCYSGDSFCAQAVEVDVAGRELKIRKIACAFDGGPMIDPANVEAQLSGGIVFGLQAALWGEVPFADGKPTPKTFGDYRMPLIGDVPPIEIALIPSGNRPGGCGESGTPPIAPALVNAIADAGGERVRRLPIARSFDV